jgi:DNA-binding MarR family transcriptional regulator
MNESEPRPEVENVDCFCLAVRRAARAVTDLYDLVLSPTGLKATQFILLRAIAGHSGLSQQRLGSELAVAPETISRRLAALKSAGWIEPKSSHTSRQHVYALTESGRARVQEAAAHWGRAQQRLRLCLGHHNWEDAMALLEKAVAAAKCAETVRIANRTAASDAPFQAGSGEAGPAHADFKAVP